MRTEARRIDVLRTSIAPFLRFFEGPVWARRDEPEVSNFAVGNPQEMPLPAYVDGAGAGTLPPQDKDWFAYKLSEPPASARGGRHAHRGGPAWTGTPRRGMTNGGFAAIAVSLRAILEPGDEVIFLSPPWFFYEILILAAGGVPVRVTLSPPASTSTPTRIEAAITPRTRAVLVNSPHNPSGRIYPLAALERLARCSAAASGGHGRAIHLSRTSRTTGSCSMGARSTARPSATPTP